MLTRRTFMQLMGGTAGAMVTGSELLSRAAASAAATVSPNGARGVQHIVVLMMENRSFDHFLG
jgi:phospholipase C